MVAAGAAGYVSSVVNSEAGGLTSFESTHTYNGQSWISTPATQTSGNALGKGANSPRAGAGGGYFGGTSTERSGSGGSSYISGHTGAVGLQESSTSSNLVFNTNVNGLTCTTGNTYRPCSYHYSGLIFKNTQMIDGTGHEWTNVRGETEVGMPNISGSGYMTGNSGNGYAKITYLGNDPNGVVPINITTLGASNDIITISTPRENTVVILDENGKNTTPIDLAPNDYVNVVSIKTKYSNEFTYYGDNTFYSMPEDAIYWYGYGLDNLSNVNTYSNPGCTFGEDYIQLGGGYQDIYTKEYIDLSQYNSVVIKKTAPFSTGRNRFGQYPDQVNASGEGIALSWESLGNDTYVADISSYTRTDMKYMSDAWAGDNASKIYYIRISPKTVEEIKAEDNYKTTRTTNVDLSTTDSFTFVHTQNTGYESLYLDSGVGSTIANSSNESVTYYNIPIDIGEEAVSVNLKGSIDYRNNAGIGDLGELYFGLSKTTDIAKDFDYENHVTISSSGTLNFDITGVESGTYYIKLYMNHNSNSSMYNVYGIIKSLTITETLR